MEREYVRISEVQSYGEFIVELPFALQRASGVHELHGQGLAGGECGFVDRPKPAMAETVRRRERTGGSPDSRVREPVVVILLGVGGGGGSGGGSGGGAAMVVVERRRAVVGELAVEEDEEGE